MPIISSDEFNLNFVSEEAQPSNDFLRSSIILKWKTTARSENKIDLVFEYYLVALQITNLFYILVIKNNRPSEI